MFKQIIGSVHRADLLPSWRQVNLSRSFTVSLSRSRSTWALAPPEERRRVHNYQGEKYKTDAKFRARIIERTKANIAARRPLLSEEEHCQRNLSENFRLFVKRRMKEGRLPDWDSHVPEVVDEWLSVIASAADVCTIKAVPRYGGGVNRMEDMR
jgi:hypothetical protein